jgi:TRAP-type C4-dicarboxylate transport system permease small subunit
MINNIEKSIRRITEIIALIGLFLLLIQAVAIVIDVLLRLFLNSPVFGMEDINQLLISVILASFFPILLINSKNITIDFLGQILGEKIKVWLDALGQLVTLLLFVLVVWQLTIFSIEVSNQHTLILQVPIAPFWWLTSGLIALCLPAQLLVTLSTIHQAINPDASGSITVGND